MKRALALVFALVLSLLVMACSGPGDDAATKFADVLNKHSAKISDGSYDSEAFLKEIKPIAEEIRELRQKDSDKKLVMSGSVKEKYEAALEAFSKQIEGAKEDKDNSKRLGSAFLAAFDLQKTVKMMGGESGDETYEEPEKMKSAEGPAKSAEEAAKTGEEPAKTE